MVARGAYYYCELAKSNCDLMVALHKGRDAHNLSVEYYYVSLRL